MRPIPDHWRRGMVRIYLATAIPWTAYFGYWANEAQDYHVTARDYLAAIDAKPGADRSGYMNAAWLRDESLKNRNLSLKLMPIIPVGLPVIALLILWISDGFRRRPSIDRPTHF